MTDTGTQMLALGITIGILLMLFALIIGDAIDDRRDRKAARDAQARLDTAREKAKA